MQLNIIFYEIKYILNLIIFDNNFNFNFYQFFGLAVVFGYDEAFKIIKSWYIIPILMIVGIYILLMKTKKDWIIKDTYFFIEEKADKVYRKNRKSSTSNKSRIL